MNEVSGNLVPMVISKDSQGERAMDIYSMLLKYRTIDMSTGFDPMSCSLVRSSMIYLQRIDPKKDINLYIDSPGGHVISGMSIVDTMRTISPKVNVTCTGMAASMGSVILAGATGKRTVMQHSQVMLHQVSGGTQGQVSDMSINTIHAKNLNTDIQRFFARVTGKSKQEILKAMDRDTWFTAQEAIDFNLADELLPIHHPYPFDIDTEEYPHLDSDIFN